MAMYCMPAICGSTAVSLISSVSVPLHKKLLSRWCK